MKSRKKRHVSSLLFKPSGSKVWPLSMRYASLALRTLSRLDFISSRGISYVIIVSRILLMSYIFQILNRNVSVFSPVFYRWNISFFKYKFQIVTFLFFTPVFKRCNTSCFSCYFSIIFYTLSLNCNVFALRVIICNTLKKKDCAFWNIGKYTVSLPLNQHCFFIVLKSYLLFFLLF